MYRLYIKENANAKELLKESLKKDYNISDRIIINMNADEEFASSIKDNIDYVKNETLALEINFDENISKDMNLNDANVGINIERKI